MSSDDRDPMERLDRLEALCTKQGEEIAELQRILRAIGVAIVGGGPEIAEEYELDGKFGDPAVKKDPTANFWKGASHVGKRLSQCSPDYLDAFAKYKDVCADLSEKKPEKRKFAEFDRRDAARARGWAKRLRSGWKPPPKPSAGDQFLPLGGAGGFGHAAETVPTFGGGGNPFAPKKTAGDAAFFGDGRARGLGDAFEPPEHDAAPPAADETTNEDFDFGANAERLPAPTASSGRVDLDDDDDDLPVMAAGGVR